MSKKYKDKMIGADETISEFHFSGAGTGVHPVTIRAKSREEAEEKFRELVDAKRVNEQKSSINPQIAPENTSEIL